MNKNTKFVLDFKPQRGFGVIYKITSPSKKIYIGKTTRRIRNRFNEHCRKRSKCYLLYNSIRKYGRNSMVLEILGVHRENRLDKEEALAIKRHKRNHYLYNLTEGGEGGYFPKGVFDANSKRMKQKYTNPAERQKQSETVKALWANEEYRKRLTEAHRGRKHSKSHCQAISDALKKRYENPTNRQRMSETMKRLWTKEEYRQKIQKKIKKDAKTGCWKKKR